MTRLSYLLRSFAAFCLVSIFTVAANASPVPNTDGIVNKGAQTHHILVVGDSLSSEYGIERHQGWVALLKKRLTEQNISAQVTNASISGDTTSGGLTRLPVLLEQHQPTTVIIELGGNDALRGLSMNMTRENLRQMVELTQKAGAQAIVVGMQIPPNYGPGYAQAFQAIFPDVAAQTGAHLVPFLLNGLETDRSLFIDDGIHPSEAAQPLLLENVWQTLGDIVSQP